MSVESANNSPIAYGVYHYYLGDEDSHINESWRIVEQENGERITWCERDAPTFQTKLITKTHTTNGLITKIEIDWHNKQPNVVHRAHATYQIHDQLLRVERSCDGAQSVEEAELSPDVLIFPLMRIHTGDILAALAQYPHGTKILVPNIREPNNPDVLLQAYFEHRQAKELRQETIEIAGTKYATRLYQYLGAEYTEDAQFWVDTHNVLVRYRWTQANDMDWQVDLVEYVRKPSDDKS